MVELEAVLTEAWLEGTQCGHAQMRERALRGQNDVQAVPIKRVESRLRTLMDSSANALNLNILSTVIVWDFLSRAWIAGTKTCEAEILGLLIQRNSDITAELQEWLEGEGEGEGSAAS